MPGMDRNGPFGTGPFGRRMGPCGPGWTGGRGFGGGRGYFHWGGPMMVKELTPEEEKRWLEEQKSWLESQLGPINNRLQELQEKKESE